MITVCAFQWFDPRGKCNHVYVYGPTHVAILKTMVAKHLRQPHRFVVVTNQPELYGDIETVPLDMTTFVPGTRYAKLMLFRQDIGEVLGERILYLDLDSVIVNALDPLVDRPEPLVLWRNPNHVYPRRARYNTSMMLLSAGVHPALYHTFDPARDPARMKQMTSGTDQAWISDRLGPDMPYWDASHGVYGAGRPGDIVRGVGESVPENARVVFFPGPREPDQAHVRATHPWIAEHRPC
jgi:hypothetical protein